MKSTKLLKSILIPTLGISAIGTIAAISTSCGSKKPDTYPDYIDITANINSTLKLNNKGSNNPDLQYSTDGTSWNTYSREISINQGQTYYLKGNNPTGWSTSDEDYSYLTITGDVSISGNVMALLDNGVKPGEQGDITGIPCDYCFYGLFINSTGITNVSEDFLPATDLAESCYEFMFQKCWTLTTAPELRAPTLAESCYENMFSDCSSLTTAPELPAMDLEQYCYQGMFSYCSSLTTVPGDLPATDLAEGCYKGMFYNCTSLTSAPELPATTLAEKCYEDMFYGCTALNSIKIHYKGNYNSSYFENWVTGVANSGTFYYNGSDSCVNFGFPSDWRIVPFN